MKIIGNIDKDLLLLLQNNGVSVDRESYDTISEAYFDQGDYDACVINIDTDDAEGIYSARSLITAGVKAPIVGISYDLYDPEIWEDSQATFLGQGGMYLLQNPPKINLLCACISQAGNLVRGNVVKKALLKFFDNKLHINLNSNMVYYEGVEVGLTSKEADVLIILAQSKDRVCSKEFILTTLYSDSIDEQPELKIIDAFICKVRKKLDEMEEGLGKVVETVWGRGYIIREESTKQSQDFAKAS